MERHAVDDAVHQVERMFGSRRAALAVGLGLFSWLLRPWPPLVWLPGWVVGGLLLWGAIELWLLAWRPQRWR